MAQTKATKDLDQEHWEADYKLRLRETELKEREQAQSGSIQKQWDADYALRTREIDIKEKEQKRWMTPVTVAIFAAAIAAGGSAVVAYINGSLQRDLDDRKSEAQLILESIKTNGDAEKAVKNLQLLVKAGLVSQHKEQLTRYLNTVKPEDRPSLGGGAIERACGDFSISASSSLNGQNNALLSDWVKAYNDCIKQLGEVVEKGKGGSTK